MTETVLAKEEERIRNMFIHSAKGRTKRHTILSNEKIRMIRAII
jgi:hypothetical protein